jgi:hypothetical protein
MTKTLTAPLGVAVLAVGALVPVGTASASAPPPLDLGPTGLTEVRTSRTVEPGVTLTQIHRGDADPSVRWVVEVNIPGGPSSPDPDAPPRAIQDRASAEAYAAKLTAAGFPAQAQEVLQPAVADVPAGVLGWRVRLTTTFASKAEADAETARLVGAGFAGRSWYAGWDGNSTARGPWTVDVVTIDPRTFHGTLEGSFGPDIERRETPSWLAQWTGASVSINAGFFVLDPKAGAEGDPAGAGVYDGRVESEAVGSRPVLVLDDNARDTEVVRPRWTGQVRLPSGTMPLDGINRVPGLIRNCGGTADDLPTALPLHDITCTDDDELVTFTAAFGATTPAGPGAEAVLDRHGRVVRVETQRGTALQPGQTSL